MKAVTKITFLDDNNEKFFGEGPARLLHGVEECGSLRAAAMSMDMAYTKALKLIKNAENAFNEESSAINVVVCKTSTIPITKTIAPKMINIFLSFFLFICYTSKSFKVIKFRCWSFFESVINLTKNR